MLAASSIDWSKWLTPETVVAVLGLIGTVLGWLGQSRAKRITTAVVKGVEAFRNEMNARAEKEDKPEKKAELKDIAETLRETIKGESLKDGVEGILNPIVQIITATMKAKK